MGIVGRNIADVAVAPWPEKKEGKTFSPAQCRLFFDAVREDCLYFFYAVAIGRGLQLGELLALSWEDVDFENATISIRRPMQGAQQERSRRTHK